MHLEVRLICTLPNDQALQRGVHKGAALQDQFKDILSKFNQVSELTVKMPSQLS